MLPLIALVLCADPVILEGDVPDDGSEFFTVPFTVEPGVAELEIRHDDLSSSNILDWGLFSPDGGFVGWGGGNSEAAIVGPNASSRSYLLTALTPGTWRVLVGKALVTQKPAKWKLEIEARSVAKLPAQTRTQWTPVTLANEPRFYAGDLHVHSTQSGDARATLEEVSALALARGLDFVALSEHNTLTTLGFLSDAQSRSPGVLLVPSVEFTTYAGHLNAFGATRLPPFWFGVTDQTLQDAVADFAAQGAVPTVNHPTLDLGTFCIGCAWRHGGDVPGLSAIEVGVGGWDETGSLFDESALAFWEAQASRGLHLTAVGGSDDHRAGVARNQTQSELGSPTTMIFASELSVAALTRGLLDGRTVVKLRGPEDPMIELGFPVGVPRDRDTFLVESLPISARVTGGQGRVLAWVENGVVVRQEGIDADPYFSSFTLEAPAARLARVRAEVRVEQQPRTILPRARSSQASTPCPSTDFNLQRPSTTSTA